MVARTMTIFVAVVERRTPPSAIIGVEHAPLQERLGRWGS
jgi:hypothetical protein